MPRLIYATLMVALFGCRQQEAERISSVGAEIIADSIIDAAFDRWSYFSENDDRCDSAHLLSEVVAEQLSERSSASWDLDSLHSHATIILSDDSAIRVIYWLAPCSGTMRRYSSVATVQGTSGRYGVHSLPADILDGEPSMSLGAITYLFHLQDSLYLAIAVGQLMGSMPFETATVMIFSPDTLHYSDISFYIDGQAISSMLLDKSWYMRHLQEFDHRIPSILTYDSKSRTLGFPTIRTSRGELLFDDVIGGPGVTVETNNLIYLTFVDTAFIEIERPSERKK